MNRLKSPATYRIFCFVVGALLFGVSLIRAAATGITYDEAYTYIYYAQKPLGFLAADLPNNHPLNSLLIYLFNTALTGIRYSEFMIRLPNLIFYALFLYLAMKAGRLFTHKYLVFALLVSNYFLSEFFGLGRGYGMSAALILAALYVYYRSPSNDPAINKTIYLLLLACFANYSALLIAGCFFVYIYLVDIRPANTLEYLRKNTLHLLVQSASFIAMFVLFIKVTGGGKPPAGAGGFEFFAAVPLSFAQGFTLDPLWSTLLAWCFVGIFLAGIAILREKIVAKPAVSIFLLYLLMNLVIARVTHQPITSGRAFLPLWPVMALAIVEILETFELCALRIPHRTLLFQGVSLILVLLLIGNFARSIRLSDTTFSKEDYPLRTMVYSAAFNHTKIDMKYKNMVTVFYGMKLREEFGIDVLYNE